MNIDTINVLVLAYLGDTIYEDYIREYLIKLGINNVNELQKESIKFVSAKSQAMFLKELLDSNFYNEKEIDIIHRARNYKKSTHPKNCDVLTYKHSTAFEAVIGYHKLNNDIERINEIINKILYKE